MAKIILSWFLFLTLSSAFAQENNLVAQLQAIAPEAKGIVGVSILGLESRDTLNFNGNARLVMHSVFKFPIAMAVLHLVDQGKYKLDQIMKVGKKDMAPKAMYSPLRDKYPSGTEITLNQLLGYMVSQSDNTACDFLLKRIGGPGTVENYMQNLGIKGINIVGSEGDMAKAWEVQYANWCKPVEAVHLLDIFFQGKSLSKTSNDFLMTIMTATTNGPKRIRGLLPKGAVLAHKTGTSGTNSEGLTAATNDIGIITLPNGKHLAIAIFVCNSTADEATREGVIAKIAKAAWEEYRK